MVLMRAEAFFVRRAGVVVAEPTGGVDRWQPSADPQRWWAEIDPDMAAVTAEHRRLVEIEVPDAFPDHGRIGRVIRDAGRAAPRDDADRRRSSDIDGLFDSLDRVPESWLPYEVRVSEVPGSGLDAFVGTLLPVPTYEIRDVLGTGWCDVIRVEPWLTPN
ncbi:hypothetical protein DEJ34_05815 [Curtobacterium sp. MCPF17_050]|uniref:hypothetical protein n=1 Tax=Curtobacterium sp. MCPF17_050 TaxID=2175664 RepID=UPI000D860ED6|nr:hypothetical protein [Curtobacterium sp. MCPF17_050]WIB16643.1 hypothetical protein DEJ34_05815 [Curtobacterium sp. MCPF17_050]